MVSIGGKGAHHSRLTAVFVNNQRGIQRQGQDYDKTHKYTQHTQLHA